MCECGELVQYGSWAGACDNEIACSVLAYVSVYRCVRVRESVPQYGPRPPGLCTSVYFRAVRVSPAFVRCEPTKTLCFGVLYELRELLCGASLQRLYTACAGACASVCCTSPRAVRAYKGFALLCTVRAPGALRGASLQRLCASVYRTSAKSFARCEPPKAFYRVRAPRALRGASLQRLCASVCCKSLTSFVRCEPTKAFYRVRAPRALRGASLQRLCASVCCKSLTSFVRCEPTKAFYRVRAPRALRGASLQRLCASVCCKSLTSFVRCEPTKAFYGVRAPRALRGASLQRLCASVCCKSLTSFCAVRAYKGFLPCAGARPSRFVMCSCTRTRTYVLSVRAHTIFVVLYGNLYTCMSRNGAFMWTSTPACVFQTPAVKNYIIGTVVKT